MALIKQNGNYIKIVSIRTDTFVVEYDAYQNIGARQREVLGSWTDFDIKQRGNFNTDVIKELVLPSQIIPNNTLEDSFKTLCYVAMLCDFSAFEGATLDTDTLAFINNLQGAELTSFTSVVNALIDLRLTEQTERDLVKSKLGIQNV